MMEMFKGVSVDRCKDVGGPPVAAPTGPSIAKLTASEGRPGTAVAVTAAAPDPARPDELHFLLKGRDIKADVTLGHASSMRAIVPDFGVKAPSKGWVYLVRGGAAGKALPFLFRERNSEPASVK